MPKADRFRVGRKLGTTIYRNDEDQPCALVPGDKALAARIVELLKADAESCMLPEIESIFRDSRRVASLYETMRTPELLDLLRAFEMDNAAAEQPESIAFAAGHIALIRHKLSKRGVGEIDALCIRASGHSGPCNGLPRPDCVSSHRGGGETNTGSNAL
jgi:hypothetical protein